MDKEQAFAFLHNLEGRGIKLGLERIRKFLCFVGNPETRFKSIHVAGTNGKGSTAAFVERILREAGYKTGLYTSPHLVSFNERIQVNGEKISDELLVKLVGEAKQEMEDCGISLTYFEFITAMAFKHFALSKVDFAVVEVGMGGRLDATNVLLPLVSVITNVEREHEAHLGDTQEEIAAEKAGVIKKHVPVVTAEWKKHVLDVFKEKAVEKESQLLVVKDPYAGKLIVLGSFQRWNAALAVASVKELQKQGIELDETAIVKGLAKAEWPGRFQIVQTNPTLVLDCAHNPACCKVLATAFNEMFPGKKALLVFGTSSDKKVGKMAGFLAPIAKKVFVTEAKYRPMPAKEVAEEFKAFGNEVDLVKGVEEAVKKAISSANPGDVVLVTGSCFVVGEAMRFIKSA